MFSNKSIFAALNELSRLARKERYWDKSSSIKAVAFVAMSYVSFILMAVVLALMLAGMFVFRNPIMLGTSIMAAIVLKGLAIAVKDIVYPILAEVHREKREAGIPLVNEMEVTGNEC